MRTGQPRRWAIGRFTDRELKVVELRAAGVKVPEIARRLGLSRTAVYNRLSRLYRKAGLTGAAQMIEWARANALDVALEVEPPIPRVYKKRGRKKIQMGRIRRAKNGARRRWSSPDIRRWSAQSDLQKSLTHIGDWWQR